MSRREGAGSRFCDYLTVDCADLPTQNSRDLTSVGLSLVCMLLRSFWLTEPAPPAATSATLRWLSVLPLGTTLELRFIGSVAKREIRFLVFGDKY